MLVGMNIRLRRLMLGITQQTLAKKINVTFQQLQKYEKGINKVSTSRLAHIAWSLNCEPTVLLKGIEQFRNEFSETQDNITYRPIFENQSLDRDLQLASLIQSLPPRAHAAMIKIVKLMGET